jgi:hypothetical protein
MQLFCVSYGIRIPSVEENSLTAALTAAGSAFPRFGEGTPWSATSASGNVVVATMHHPDDLVGPRSYRARVGDVVVAFDGLPVHRSGGWPAHDAEALLTHWGEMPDAVEGQFTALRVDLARDDVAFVTDSFGIAPLYYLSHDGGHIVSNSVEALRLVTGGETPSPLGVSSLAATGWPAGDSTLLAGIRALAGGHEYRLNRSGLVSLPYLTPATLAAHARSGRRISTDQIVTELIDLTSAAVSAGLPFQSGLTAGRDSRLLVALLLASGAHDVGYYTYGRDGEPDVDGARRVARELDLHHEVWPLEALDDAVDWVTLVKMFVSQTDGLSSLIQIGDYHDQLRAPPILGVKTAGLGGEFGRCGHTNPIPFASNVPLFMFSLRVQEMLLTQRAHEYERLWTADAMNEIKGYIRGFVQERRSEAWKIREVSEAYYAFDRVARWGSTSLRRTAGTDDFFTPYCSRAFANYCFSLTSEERYVEASHYRILSALSPKLRDLPFAQPWKKQSPHRVPLKASYDLGKALLRRSERFNPLSRQSKPGPPSYWTAWFDAHAEEHMDLCLSLPDSPLWAWIDRSAVEQAFRAEPKVRARIGGQGLARVVTLFWYFHGRHLR